MHFDEFICRLRNVRKINKQTATASCPAHKDQKPSLRITVGHKQPIVLTCYAGCSPLEIVESMGLTFADLCEERDLPIGNGMAQPTIDRQIVIKAAQEQIYLAFHYLKAVTNQEISPEQAATKLLVIYTLLEKAYYQL